MEARRFVARPFAHNARVALALSPALAVGVCVCGPAGRGCLLLAGLAAYAFDLARSEAGALAAAWAGLAGAAVCCAVGGGARAPGRGAATTVAATLVLLEVAVAAGVWLTLQFKGAVLSSPSLAAKAERVLLAAAPPLGAACFGWAALDAVGPEAAAFYTLIFALFVHVRAGTRAAPSFAAPLPPSTPSSTAAAVVERAAPGWVSASCACLLPAAAFAASHAPLLRAAGPKRGDALASLCLLTGAPVLVLTAAPAAWGALWFVPHRVLQRYQPRVRGAAIYATAFGLYFRVVIRAVAPYVTAPPPWDAYLPAISFFCGLTCAAVIASHAAMARRMADDDALREERGGGRARARARAYFDRVHAVTASAMAVASAGAAARATGVPLWWAVGLGQAAWPYGLVMSRREGRGGGTNPARTRAATASAAIACAATACLSYLGFEAFVIRHVAWLRPQPGAPAGAPTPAHLANALLAASVLSLALASLSFTALNRPPAPAPPSLGGGGGSSAAPRAPRPPPSAALRSLLAALCVAQVYTVCWVEAALVAVGEADDAFVSSHDPSALVTQHPPPPHAPYPPWAMIATSAACVAASRALRRAGLAHRWALTAVWLIHIAKLAACLLQPSTALHALPRAVLLLAVAASPFALLRPAHAHSSASASSSASSQPFDAVPRPLRVRTRFPAALWTAHLVLTAGAALRARLLLVDALASASSTLASASLLSPAAFSPPLRPTDSTVFGSALLCLGSLGAATSSIIVPSSPSSSPPLAPRRAALLLASLGVAVLAVLPPLPLRGAAGAFYDSAHVPDADDGSHGGALSWASASDDESMYGAAIRPKDGPASVAAAWAVVLSLCLLAFAAAAHGGGMSPRIQRAAAACASASLGASLGLYTFARFLPPSGGLGAACCVAPCCTALLLRSLLSSSASASSFSAASSASSSSASSSALRRPPSPVSDALLLGAMAGAVPLGGLLLAVAEAASGLPPGPAGDAARERSHAAFAGLHAASFLAVAFAARLVTGGSGGGGGGAVPPVPRLPASTLAAAPFTAAASSRDPFTPFAPHRPTIARAAGAAAAASAAALGDAAAAATYALCLLLASASAGAEAASAAAYASSPLYSLDDSFPSPLDSPPLFSSPPSALLPRSTPLLFSTLGVPRPRVLAALSCILLLRSAAPPPQRVHAHRRAPSPWAAPHAAAVVTLSLAAALAAFDAVRAAPPGSTALWVALSESASLIAALVCHAVLRRAALGGVSDGAAMHAAPPTRSLSGKLAAFSAAATAPQPRATRAALLAVAPLPLLPLLLSRVDHTRWCGGLALAGWAAAQAAAGAARGGDADGRRL